VTSPTKPPYVPGRSSVYPVQVPAWVDLVAQHGFSTGPEGQELPWPTEPTHKNVQRVLWLVLIGLTLTVLAAAGYLVQHNNWLPVSVPLIGKDSGVAACETIANGGGVAGSGDTTWSAADYRAARQVFADSRYPAIRDNGVQLMDLAWQMQGLKADDMGLLLYVTPMTNAYAGLAGGCAEVGYTIPALGSK